MTMLLIPTMMFMWLISGLFIWGLVPPINYVRQDTEPIINILF